MSHVSKNFSTISNRYRKSRQLCLILNFRGITLSFSFHLSWSCLWAWKKSSLKISFVLLHSSTQLPSGLCKSLHCSTRLPTGLYIPHYCSIQHLLFFQTNSRQLCYIIRDWPILISLDKSHRFSQTREVKLTDSYIMLGHACTYKLVRVSREKMTLKFRNWQ